MHPLPLFDFNPHSVGGLGQVVPLGGKREYIDQMPQADGNPFRALRRLGRKIFVVLQNKRNVGHIHVLHSLV